MYSLGRFSASLRLVSPAAIANSEACIAPRRRVYSGNAESPLVAADTRSRHCRSLGQDEVTAMRAQVIKDRLIGILRWIKSDERTELEVSVKKRGDGSGHYFVS